jgi:hypothetical protein
MPDRLLEISNACNIAIATAVPVASAIATAECGVREAVNNLKIFWLIKDSCRIALGQYYYFKGYEISSRSRFLYFFVVLSSSGNLFGAEPVREPAFAGR